MKPQKLKVMEITNQMLMSLSHSELRDLNKRVIEVIKRKRAIETIEKSAVISKGDIITCSIDKKPVRYCITEITRVNVVAKSLKTGVPWVMPISTITVVESAK